MFPSLFVSSIAIDQYFVRLVSEWHFQFRLLNNVKLNSGQNKALYMHSMFILIVKLNVPLLSCTFCTFVFIPPSPPPPFGGDGGWGDIEITFSVIQYVWALSDQYLLNIWTFCNQTWYDDASFTKSWDVMQSNWIGVFMVKVTLKVQISKHYRPTSSEVLLQTHLLW